MNQNIFIFEVTKKNFPSAVVDNSHKLPVVVGFFAAWSEYCFVTDELFSRLAKEFAGKFVFAKVDIDEQPELRKQYQIENVPTMLVFKNGEVVRTDLGQLLEPEARAMLREFGISHPSDEMREQAREKHMGGDTATAIMLLTQAIQLDPKNTRVAMDMTQIFIDVGDIDNAQGLFSKLPETDRSSDIGKSLSGQININQLAAKTDGLETLQTRVISTPDDMQARFDLSLCLIARHDYQTAMDHLLKILTTMPEFQDGAAKEMMIVIINMLTPGNPGLAKEYQRKLSNLVAGQ